MIEEHLRPSIQKHLIDPLAKTLLKIFPASAIFYTIMSGFMGLIAAFCIAQEVFLLSVVFLLLSGLLDVVDGTVARITNQRSSLGTFLDIFMDRFVEGCVILALYYVAPLQRASVCCWMFFSVYLCVTSFLMVGMVSKNTSEKSFHYSPGLMERAEAFIFFILMIYLPSLFNILGMIFIALVMWTTLYRIVEFLRQSPAEETT